MSFNGNVARECKLSARAMFAIVAIASAALAGGAYSFMNEPNSGKPPVEPSALVRELARTSALRDVTPTSAVLINRSIAFSKTPNPPASPFVPPTNQTAYERALECLTTAIYYEAANESLHGQRAVAQVVLNRARHPAFGDGVCGVVYEGSTRPTGCQFSFTCDGSLVRAPGAAGWKRARAIAEAALKGAVYAPVGYATHYHANYVVPYWATSLSKDAVEGSHVFYRWPGWWGQAAAFRRRLAGPELDPRLLRYAALRGHSSTAHTNGAPLITIDERVELASIVHLLAGRSDLPDTKYHGAVRDHFSSFGNHVAVEIYRQLAAANPEFVFNNVLEAVMYYSPPPEIAPRGRVPKHVIRAAGDAKRFNGFIAALRDFARHTDFGGFWRKAQPLHAELEKDAQDPALALMARTQSESGTPVDGVRLLLAPLLHKHVHDGCEPMIAQDSQPWLLLGAATAAERTISDKAALRKYVRKVSARACRHRSV